MATEIINLYNTDITHDICGCLSVSSNHMNRTFKTFPSCFLSSDIDYKIWQMWIYKMNFLNWTSYCVKYEFLSTGIMTCAMVYAVIICRDVSVGSFIKTN